MARRIECDGCGVSCDEKENALILKYRFSRHNTDINAWTGDLCGPCFEAVVKSLSYLRCQTMKPAETGNG